MFYGPRGKVFVAGIKLSVLSSRLICKGWKVNNHLHLSMLRGKHRIILHPQQVMNLHKERAGLEKMLIRKASNNQEGRHRICTH